MWGRGKSGVTPSVPPMTRIKDRPRPAESDSAMLNAYDRDQLRQRFRSARPFPHIVIDQFLEPAAAAAVAASYPTFATAQSMGTSFRAVNEQKKVQITDPTRFPEPVQRLNQELASARFLDDLAYITGIPKLLADDKLVGGGMHVSGPGGRLDVHVDFNYNEESHLHRRLNILIYLNPVWQPAWGGEIELWDEQVKECGQRLLPALNRCVIFETTNKSYHGVRPITAPVGIERKSFAGYYYTAEAPAGWDGQKHSTLFRARPDERLRGYLLMPAERIRNEIREGLFRVRRKVKKLLLGAK